MRGYGNLVTDEFSLFGLGAFLWTLCSGQYSDTKGDAERIICDDDKPLPPSEVDKE